MNPGWPAPLPDGTYRPAKGTRNRAVIGAVITLGGIYTLIFAVQEDLSNPKQLVGVIAMSILVLFFGLVTLTLFNAMRHARLVVDAGGLSFTGNLASKFSRHQRFRQPWSEFGTTYLLWTVGPRRDVPVHPVAQAMLPPMTTYELILTDRYQRPLVAFVSPAWSQEHVLALAARLQAETGNPITAFEVERLRYPVEFGESFTPQDARALQGGWQQDGWQQNGPQQGGWQ